MCDTVLPQGFTLSCTTLHRTASGIHPVLYYSAPYCPRDLGFAYELQRAAEESAKESAGGAEVDWSGCLAVGSLVAGTVAELAEYGTLCDLDAHPVSRVLPGESCTNE